MVFSIRQKVTAVILFASLIPTALLGFFSYKSANDALENELKNAAEQSMQRIQDSTTLYLEGYEQNLKRLGKEEDTLIAALQGDTVEALKNFQIYKETNVDILNVYLGTKSKSMIMYPAAEVPPGFDPTATEWYQRAVSSGEVIWTEPYVDTRTKKLVISATKPVQDPLTKEVVGVVGVDIALDTLSALVGDMKIGRQGYIFLLDQSGKVMTHPDTTLIGEEVPVEKLRAAVAQEHGIVDYTYDGEEKFGIFATYPKTQWKFIGVLGYNEIDEAVSQILKNTIIYCAIFAALAIAFGMFTTHGFTKAIKDLLVYSEKIGSGDFTVRAKTLSRDETGALTNTLNQMVIQLAGLMGNIKYIAEEMNTSAEELAASAEETMASSEEVNATAAQIAGGASDQAVQAEKGTQMVTALATKIQALEVNSAEMVNSSVGAKEANERGLHSVEHLRVKTEESRLAVDQINEVIRNLDGKSQAIGSILSAITSIAEQTNLLALNASIEAARAGEAGRGFSVVADEIRKLAEQSAQSVQGIQGIVEDIQRESSHAVGVMKEVRNHSEATVQSVEDVNQSFAEISQAMDTIREKITHTTALIQEMTMDSNQVVDVIQSISAVTEETSAASEEVSASMEQTASAFSSVAKTAEELEQLAGKLSLEVARFKI
ncbi:methyl-accepting chemotaxis protein [Desulfitobacterium dehalogenans ATCC 51507]|uniref:Methyl-accepting chemotaxis protein n=1 Tax=Desulfitobacterium dehalogenans (strain ATCC 51507 / DSM 9161 / JW/IU-DC1) TaxID=756499 RepID=I4A6V7_DESDJ|nr:methyl-accepting chemotaxis protein [Desulfitobacterium dehalogenans]AFL99691.1 methyl-accepting chemotaxis protein [Desulfitobacterium dehalogenans ATCC 51507]